MIESKGAINLCNCLHNDTAFGIISMLEREVKTKKEK